MNDQEKDYEGQRIDPKTWRSILRFAAPRKNCFLVILGGGMLAAAWVCAGISFSRFQTLELVCSAFALLLLVVLPTVPAIVPHREDYYDGGEKSA